jgi:translation initiation factor 3 subunit I
MQPFAFHGHNRPVMAIQFNAEGDLLFSAGKDGMIAAWRTSDGERLGTFGGERLGHKTVSDLDVNNATTLLASTGGDFKTFIWNAQTGDILVDIELKCPARCVKFAHDDSMFLNVTDGKMGEKPSIHIYNLPPTIGVQPTRAAFNPFVSYTTPEQMMYAQWGPTNDTIYFCSDDGSVSILDVETQKEVTSAMPHAEEVRKIHFDPTYRTLVTASKDRSAKLLDSRSLKTICTYQTDTPVNDASVSPIFDHIVLGGGTEAQDVTTTGGGSSFNAKFYHGYALKWLQDMTSLSADLFASFLMKLDELHAVVELNCAVSVSQTQPLEDRPTAEGSTQFIAGTPPESNPQPLTTGPHEDHSLVSIQNNHTTSITPNDVDFNTNNTSTSTTQVTLKAVLLTDLSELVVRIRAESRETVLRLRALQEASEQCLLDLNHHTNNVGKQRDSNPKTFFPLLLQKPGFFLCV